MPTHTYTVTGMTCGHCEQAVRTGVTAVPGVTGVTVDHATGRLDVEGEADTTAVVAAVTEAGYTATPAA